MQEEINIPKEETYECVSCRRTATVEPTKEPPICCGKLMRKMPREICLQPTHAEHARPMEPEDACDEFRAGE